MWVTVDIMQFIYTSDEPCRLGSPSRWEKNFFLALYVTHLPSGNATEEEMLLTCRVVMLRRRKCYSHAGGGNVTHAPEEEMLLTGVMLIVRQSDHPTVQTCPLPYGSENMQCSMSRRWRKTCSRRKTLTGRSPRLALRRAERETC